MMGEAVMTKLHQGELIGLLKKKGHFTYIEIADGVGKTERTIQYWEKDSELELEIREALAQFFGVDVRAFVNEEVRKKVLSEYKSSKVKSSVAEQQVAYEVQALKKQLEKFQDEILRAISDLKKKK